MANKIVLKKTSTASKVPLSTDLEVGEIAVNLADQKLYSKNAGGTVILVGSGTGGTGDVVGPASATDNALARFDTTTGKLIQNSTITLDDNGNVINANSLGLDTTPATVPATVGTMSWDDGDGVPSVLLKGGNTTLQVGTQEYARVYNDNGTTITKGQVVYISGAQGNRVAVKLARANLEATSFGTIGIVAETIANGAEGFIIVSGALYKLDTTGLTAGATVYLSPSTAGAITTTKPQAPDQLVVLGWVERVNATVGSIYVKIDNGYELDELHDVRITSPVSGNLLIYDATTSPIGVWKNASLTAGTGISVTNGAGSVTIGNSGVTSAVAGTGISVSGATGAVTITNSAPDQTVTLTGAGATTISGTYPNFTITSVNTTYSAATSTTLGLIELGSDTVQSVAANAVSATASRSYALQVNSAGQGIVNVPWTDTNSGGTVTSITAGTGLSGGTITTSGTIALANTAVTAGSYTNTNITVDAQGRITSASNGSAGGVTSFSAGTTGLTPSTGTTGAITLAGTLAIANGGTGQTTATNAFNALNPMTTAGDILYEASGGLAARLPIGTAGQVLSVSSGLPAWTTPAGGGGKVLQVVNFYYTTGQTFSLSSGAYTDTGLTATITPSSASSKVLVFVSAMHQTFYGGSANINSSIRLKRNSTVITNPIGSHPGTVNNAETIAPVSSINYLDSPATTSATTYTVQTAPTNGGQTVYFNRNYSATGWGSFITLMEIGA